MANHSEDPAARRRRSAPAWRRHHPSHRAGGERGRRRIPGSGGMWCEAIGEATDVAPVPQLRGALHAEEVHHRESVEGTHDQRAFVVVVDQARERREGVVVEGCVIRPGRIVGRDDRNGGTGVGRIEALEALDVLQGKLHGALHPMGRREHDERIRRVTCDGSHLPARKRPSSTATHAPRPCRARKVRARARASHKAASVPAYRTRISSRSPACSMACRARAARSSPTCSNPEAILCER